MKLTHPIRLGKCAAEHAGDRSALCRCWAAGSLGCWFTGLLVHWAAGSLGSWFTGQLVHWAAGSDVSDYRFFCGMKSPLVWSEAVDG